VIKAKQTFPAILPLWQPIGYSTYQIANTLANKYGVKVTHTGVLDPLAEGVVIFLLGDERFRKNEFSECKKTYDFDIVFGISTDSYDGMGLITETDFNNTAQNPDKIKQVLSSFVGKYTQTVPLYSAVKYQGKKLFIHAKANTPIDNLPSKTGEIYALNLFSTDTVLAIELIDQIIANVSKIKAGQFRQTEIISSWKALKTTLPPELKLQKVSLAAQISRGLYVRSLSQDICTKLGLTGFVSKLVRTQNGIYTQQNSTTLQKEFGDNFDHSMLVSKYL
jgi:tRNA pseudouridine55 synthase